MNPVEVRYLLHQALLNADSAVTSTLISPEVGQPVEIKFVIKDPYAGDPNATRTYRITVEEERA